MFAICKQNHFLRQCTWNSNIPKSDNFGLRRIYGLRFGTALHVKFNNQQSWYDCLSFAIGTCLKHAYYRAIPNTSKYVNGKVAGFFILFMVFIDDISAYIWLFFVIMLGDLNQCYINVCICLMWSSFFIFYVRIVFIISSWWYCDVKICVFYNLLVAFPFVYFIWV